MKTGMTASLTWAAGRAVRGQSQPAATPSADPIRIAIVGVGGRGKMFLRDSLKQSGVEVAALCDIEPEHARQGVQMVRQASKAEPPVYTRGPEDYRRLLDRDDIDAVFITTPAWLHGPMATDSLRAGKWVFSEVPACYTIEQAWNLVEAAEKTEAGYFLAENYLFTRQNLLVLNMVEKGLFGRLTFAECGYIHDCRSLMFEADGELTWRGRGACDPAYSGNAYPTHSLGPVSTWLGITRGDRFIRCVSMESAAAARKAYAVRRFGTGSEQAKIDTWRSDCAMTMIQCESGALIVLRYDTASARPHHMDMYTLQGTGAAYDDGRGLYVEGKSKGWEPLTQYQDEHDHPYWLAHREQALSAGHGGGDFYTLQHFYNCIRRRQRPGIDVYDAVAWSAIAELSRLSIQADGRPQECPDFTRGKWKSRRRYDWAKV